MQQINYVRYACGRQGESMDTGQVDVKLLSQLLQSKRGNKSLREAAADIGITAPTLQRLEGGQTPTVDTLVKLVRWLGVSIDDLRAGPKKPKRDTLTEIEVLLRADPKLDGDAAETIANVARPFHLDGNHLIPP